MNEFYLRSLPGAVNREWHGSKHSRILIGCLGGAFESDNEAGTQKLETITFNHVFKTILAVCEAKKKTLFFSDSNRITICCWLLTTVANLGHQHY